jgi:ParB-like nuclease domain
MIQLEEPLLVRVADIDFAKDTIIARFENEPPESEDLEQLIRSVKKEGIIQPIVVRPKGNRRYETIAGNRRLRAAKIAKLETIPVVVRDLDDKHARRIAYIENAIRRELNAIHKAKGIASIYEDVGIPRERAIQIVHFIANEGEDKNLNIKDLVKSRLTNKRERYARSEDLLTFIDEHAAQAQDAYDSIPVKAVNQYQSLQTIMQLPEQTQEVLEKAPRLSLGKTNLLTHSRLQKYPEIQTFLANKIKDPKITIPQAKAIVDQGIHDIETGELEVKKDQETGESHVTKGSGDLSEDVTEAPELEKTFDMLIPEMMKSIKQTIGKILQRPLSKGQLIYTEDIYKPKLIELEKNLRRVKKTDKEWISSQAAVLSKVCKIIVDSAK